MTNLENIFINKKTLEFLKSKNIVKAKFCLSFISIEGGSEYIDLDNGIVHFVKNQDPSKLLLRDAVYSSRSYIEYYDDNSQLYKFDVNDEDIKIFLCDSEHFMFAEKNINSYIAYFNDIFTTSCNH